MYLDVTVSHGAVGDSEFEATDLAGQPLSYAAHVGNLPRPKLPASLTGKVAARCQAPFGKFLLVGIGDRALAGAVTALTGKASSGIDDSRPLRLRDAKGVSTKRLPQDKS